MTPSQGILSPKHGSDLRGPALINAGRNLFARLTYALLEETDVLAPRAKPVKHCRCLRFSIDDIVDDSTNLFSCDVHLRGHYFSLLDFKAPGLAIRTGERDFKRERFN